MLKRTLSLFMVAILLMATMIGCSSKPETEGEKEVATASEEVIDKKDLVIALASDITSLDPQGHNDVKSEKVSFLVFNRLFRLNKDFEVVPDLAEKWEQPSDKEWVIKIKEGVKFHDGTDLTAEDVKFSLERSFEQPKVKHVLAEVEKIEKLDDYTIKVTTKNAFAPFLYTLIHSGTSIVPKAYVEGGGDFATPVGSGPYTFGEWVSGDKVVLKKNEAYFDENNMGQMETITFRVIPEETSRTIALETGEVDIVDELPSIDISKVESNGNLEVYTNPSTKIDYFGMNVEKAPFDNKLVRQAMNYAIDKQAVITVAINGVGVEAKSVLAPGMLGYKAANYTYDPAKAKELLKEAGYEDGLEVSIWASGDVRKRISEVIQANLSEVGIKANIEMLEWGTLLEKLRKGDHQTFPLGWNSNPDPDSTLTPLYASEGVGVWNFTRTADPKVDEYITKARTELDLEKRKAIYNEFHEYIMDQAPIVPLFVKNHVVGANKGLKNIELNPQGLCNLEKITY